MESKEKKIRIIIRAAGLLLLVLLWEILARFYSNDIIFPPFIDTIIRIKEIVMSKEMLLEIVVTTERGIKGIIFGAVLGVVLGLISGINRYIRSLIMPVMMFMQATPVISFLLLFLIWFDNKLIPFIVVVISIAPLFAINVDEGIKNTDKKLIEMAKFYKIKNMKIIREIYIPAVSGYMISALKSALGITFRVAVMAEVLAHPGNGIGDRMNSARINVETIDIFAWTIIIVLFTVIFEQIITFVFGKILTHRAK